MTDGTPFWSISCSSFQDVNQFCQFSVEAEISLSSDGTTLYFGDLHGTIKALTVGCDHVQGCNLNSSDSSDSVFPSPRPSGTNNPSATTSESPSTVPTISTVSPTNSPTRSPSHTPTTQSLFLTLPPSNQPTLSPNNQPTLSPSNQPTLSPSNQPTYSPTSQPTKMPTVTLTAVPSSVQTQPEMSPGVDLPSDNSVDPLLRSRPS
eukprot:CAMPEP_0183321496 /NCGR_PEP_ID=MMETSP0160_2-20130417/69017_1 /TAXON_ID=2839 ORGANISM="Odontella Sinensis, Strain Grunow 1884" /NCGR_SAMPLE_ID=MMETSP0160_2 /ASSEMBLY_ACC=CAM_ASM_000250 /LENGTH=204 /DNA_ID=CAMNT_0025488447 /DNA_START=99 /DNA_END=710 /DNA_ORIENTATION=-